MKISQNINSANGDKDAVLSNVALLYYGEGLTQGEIAKRFKVSRATIVNMLRDCREKGIVEIRVDGKFLAGSNLSRELRDKYGLRDVYISSVGTETSLSRGELLVQISRVAAMAVLDIVEAGDRIGVAWGETIAAMAQAIPVAHVPDTVVCQLIGSKDSERVPASEACAIEVAKKLGAVCHTLHAPGIVSTNELAKAFRNEPTIQTQLARLSELDVIISSIGNVNKDTHLVSAGIASEAELTNANSQGARGIIACRFIDQNGGEVLVPPHDRIISASLEDLRKPPKKLLVVCGVDRLEATKAAIAGELVSHLVVDSQLAQALLD